MIWWLKARRGHVAPPLGLLALAVLSLFLQDSAVQLPSLSLSGDNETKVMLFAPLPLVATLALSLDSWLPAAETSGSRPTRALDCLLIASVMLAAVAICLGLGVLVDSDTVLTAGRNTVFLTGLMLCARPFTGQPAVLVPVAWVAAVVQVGFRGTNDPYPWTVVPETLGAAHSAVAAALVLAAGLVLHLRPPRSSTT